MSNKEKIKDTEKEVKELESKLSPDTLRGVKLITCSLYMMCGLLAFMGGRYIGHGNGLGFLIGGLGLFGVLSMKKIREQLIRDAVKRDEDI